jgi:hypothetical protein
MRSDFLVHWTGKDIGFSPLDDAMRDSYVERLVDILVHGFWMTTPTERMEGYMGSFIKYDAHMTCFTEIRLSQASKHASLYGSLGVGVDRKFVLDRYGSPVHYVRNHPEECLIGNAQELNNFLNSKGDVRAKEIFKIMIHFMKAMSNPNSDDFRYLDEHEWRIVQTDTQIQANRIDITGIARPALRVPVPAGDLRLVVFPDDQTRARARSEARIAPWLNHAQRPPILLTLEECQHF